MAKDKIGKITKVAVLALVLTLGTGYVLAQQDYSWVAPDGPPEGNNVAPPINVSGAYQYKDGNIGAEKFVASRVDATSQFCLGTPEDCIDSWSQASDVRLKSNLLGISEDGLSALERVSGLNGFFFNWNDTYKKAFRSSDENRQVGLIAQDVEKVLPEVVSSVSRGGEEYKTVDYEKVVPLLVEAIKEQQEMIENQQRQIDELKRMIR